MWHSACMHVCVCIMAFAFRPSPVICSVTRAPLRRLTILFFVAFCRVVTLLPSTALDTGPGRKGKRVREGFWRQGVHTSKFLKRHGVRNAKPTHLSCGPSPYLHSHPAAARVLSPCTATRDLISFFFRPDMRLHLLCIRRQATPTEIK